MKLLYLNKIGTNVGWGLETFIDRSLRVRGIETICVDYQANAYLLADSLLKITDNFDAVILQRGCGYLIPLEILQAIDRPKFLVFTELIERNHNQHYLLKSSIFEHIFFRSLPCMQLAVDRGWRERERMGLFLSAIDPSFHHPIEDMEKDIDILFVGTLLPRRQQIVAELSKEYTIATHNAFGKEMVELVNRAKIVLNIHGEDLLDTETRVYETLACRGFLLTETLSAENPFQDGVHLVEAAGIADLSAKIAYYLDHPHERATIAAAGFTEVIAQHTFDERASQIERVIRASVPPEPPATDPLDRSRLQQCSKRESYARAKDTTFRTSRRWLSSVKQTLMQLK
jgi:spore maturation protein CgeB